MNALFYEKKEEQETVRLFQFNRRCFVAVARPKMPIHQAKNKIQSISQMKMLKE